ncbi:hypothetical protein IQ268_16750 [Oculatella sp. LEGE 06141]|uniref:hypothetical protein n=1 Tax=Oculatella sp. LEGE 06141 TaxID=1828648 RepID=UPI0018809A83|nr:hypothetical protein [Oculatella sp. LEGE 06141]MBE9180214.1 hypothetical protein [Oculatella sp. LEGE 06141]
MSMSASRRSYSLKLETLILLTVAIGLLLSDLVFNASSFSTTATLTGSIGVSALIWHHEFNMASRWLGQINRRFYLPTVLMVLVGSLFVLNILSAPASAQFYQGAQDAMTGFFPGAEEVIALVFNVLRGLFLIYLGISLVKVVQAQRQDEDWQNLARTPLIILIAMTLGDVLAGFITGGVAA